MENIIRKGYVTTVPMEADQIVSGTIAVLSNLGTYTLCTVKHITAEGYWSIHSSHNNGPVPPEGTLCILIIKDKDTDEQWPIKLNQWKPVVRSGEINVDQVVDFEVIPTKFVEGFYNNICSLCNASFVGHKRQPICRECCDANAAARIITAGQKKTAKKKKAKTYPEGTVMSAFIAGSLGGQDWETWKKNNL